MVLTLIWICRIQWWSSLFLLLIGNNLFGQICFKKSNDQFKLKFGICTNSNMQNSIVVFTFFVFDQKFIFWENLVQNVKIVRLRLNLQNSMMLFTFFVFDWKYTFWANLVQKIKIVSLSWNFEDTYCFC